MDRVSIGRNISMVARRLRLLRNHCLSEAGCKVGGAYFHIFMFFANHDGCSEKLAACAVGKDKTYVAKAVKKLTVQGMIICRRDDADARCIHIHLTQQGRAEYEKAEKALCRINGILSRGISDDQINAFLKTLDLIQCNVGKRLEKE